MGTSMEVIKKLDELLEAIKKDIGELNIELKK